MTEHKRKAKSRTPLPLLLFYPKQNSLICASFIAYKFFAFLKYMYSLLWLLNLKILGTSKPPRGVCIEHFLLLVTSHVILPLWWIKDVQTFESFWINDQQRLLVNCVDWYGLLRLPLDVSHYHHVGSVYHISSKKRWIWINIGPHLNTQSFASWSEISTGFQINSKVPCGHATHVHVLNCKVCMERSVCRSLSDRSVKRILVDVRWVIQMEETSLLLLRKRSQRCKWRPSMPWLEVSRRKGSKSM